LIEICGELDELNCSIGLSRSAAMSRNADLILADIQNDLFAIGSFVSGCMSQSPPAVTLSPKRLSVLEAEIDELSDQLPELREFILPGGHPIAAQLHVARAVCRRAERRLVGWLQSHSPKMDLHPILQYLNRLSDLLFVIARFVNSTNGVAEEKWIHS
jgi:cob(I)alamin adenosyltransferase